MEDCPVNKGYSMNDMTMPRTSHITIPNKIKPKRGKIIIL